MTPAPPRLAARAHIVDRLGRDATERIERQVATECPIAIEFNGLGYAVMMASPQDLEDFAIGFALGERLIDRADQVVDIDAHDGDAGVVLRITLATERIALLHTRIRHRISDSSCGLCGIENLEQALRPLPRVEARPQASRAAIFAALEALRAHQPLNALTGAVHAAAWCAPDGAIRMAREDVGRHNAFDKLIGAMLVQGSRWDGGFALLSSRCSYELVEKAALADCPMLVTISAATDLAIRRAAEAGIDLIMLARSDALLSVPRKAPC